MDDARRLLTMSPLRSVVQLALPTTAVMGLGAASGVCHTYFVSRLGTDAIAAVSLVFPVSLVAMTMMGGGIGSGVSAAIANALGGGRRADADRIAASALWLTAAISAVVTATLVACGPALFGALGGRGDVLDAAVAFARVLFGGSIVTFTVSAFDSILRGQGNVRVPSLWASVSLTLQILLTPLFMFPLGIGLVGAAAATLAGQLVGAVPRAVFLFGGRGVVRPRLARPGAAPIRAILGIGVPASLATLANYLGLMLLTGVVARYGATDVAAFGLGTRLDFVIITLAFGVGSAVLTLVGLAAGAGDAARARAVVARSLALVSAVLAVLALALFFRPALWLGLFSTDRAIFRTGGAYLRAVAPTYPFVGASMVLSFAFQGLGRALTPLVLMLGRTVVVVAGALGLARLGAPVSSIFLVMAAGNVAMSAVLAWRLHVVFAVGEGVVPAALRPVPQA